MDAARVLVVGDDLDIAELVLHPREAGYRAGRGDTAAGAGLGPTVSRRMLALHGARLEVESEVGVGATLRFSLPTV